MYGHHYLNNGYNPSFRDNPNGRTLVPEPPNSVVVTGLATKDGQPDAIGWRDRPSTLIECKATASDFLAIDTVSAPGKVEEGEDPEDSRPP